MTNWAFNAVQAGGKTEVTRTCPKCGTTKPVATLETEHARIGRDFLGMCQSWLYGTNAFPNCPCEVA